MKQGTPKISIVLPVYKGIRSLRMALDSVKAQTFGDWECICVDDGSKDGSGALADEIAATDVRIRVIHQPNAGTSVARNVALDVARGDFLAFLDEDDAYHPRFLETLLSVQEQTGADVVGCDFLHFADDAVPEFTTPPPEPSDWQVAGRVELASWMAKFYRGIPFEVWRNLYRREVVADHRFVPGVRVEQDLLWHYTLLPGVSRYVKLPWHGYAWRESLTGGYLHPDPDSLASLLKTYRHILETVMPQMGLSPEQAQELVGCMSMDVRWNVWRHLHQGLSLSPEQSSVLRRAANDLLRYGVDVRHCLRRVRRWRWSLFLLTGWAGFVRGRQGRGNRLQ